MPEITQVPIMIPNEEDDVTKTEKIKELRKLVEDCDNLERRTDDIFLSRYLNCCDWNVNDAFQRLLKIFKLKTDNEEWFLDKPPSQYKTLLNRNIKFVLDKRDRNGRRIYVTRLGNLKTSETSVLDLAHLDDLWFEFMLSELDTQVNGVTCLIDMNGYSLKSLRYLTPGNVRVGSQKADLLPLKHMEFHIVNSSMFLNAAVSIIYPVLSKQIKDNVHFHYTNWNSLHTHIDKECLPEEYGGTDGSDFDYKQIYANLYAKEEHFLDGICKYENILKPADTPDLKGKKSKSKKKKGDKLIMESFGDIGDCKPEE